MFDDLSFHAGAGDVKTRQAWLAVLARAEAAEILARLAQAPPLPDFTMLRGPEIGLVMARGRIGGGGGAFNLGEMTVARCSIRDATGRAGHGYAMGRDAARVELMARLDAVLQDPSRHRLYWNAVIEPLAASAAARRAAQVGKVASTDVKFFTLATMRS